MQSLEKLRQSALAHEVSITIWLMLVIRESRSASWSTGGANRSRLSDWYQMLCLSIWVA